MKSGTFVSSVRMGERPDVDDRGIEVERFSSSRVYIDI